MRKLCWPALLVVASGLIALGWRLMSTTFMIHDDEGYVLLSLRNFVEHGRLYAGGVFTQYGPAPFLYYESLHRALGFPIDNGLGRVMATVHWTGAALAAGLLAWRLSDRFWTALFTLVAVFGYLWQMTWEPAHPGGLIAVVAAGGLAAVLGAWSRDRHILACGLLGATGAVLLLTKINVGLLWCCAVGAFLLLETGGALRGRGPWLAAAGLAILPFVLMRPLLAEPWVRNLAIMSSLTGVALCLPSYATPMARLRWTHWLAAGTGLASVATIIVAATLVKGTGAMALVHGVLVDPLRHPTHFQVRLTWDNLSWVLQAITLAICGLWTMRPELRARLADLVAGLRLAALAVFIWQLEGWISVQGLGCLIRYGLPVVPLFLLPLDEAPGEDASRTALRLVAIVGCTQVLHAYPVAGSQMAWGAFLLVPLGAHGLAEAAAHCARRLKRAWLPAAVAGLGLLAATAQSGMLAAETNRRWQSSESLNVPGFEFLRPQENVRLGLGIVAANARLHADMLFSRPGMFSFNLWTGVPTPTLRNTTHWFWLLTPEDQQAIISRLGEAARPVVVSSQPLIDALRDRMDVTITGPLQDYLVRDYHPLFTVSGYEFLVPQGSRAAPFFVAQNYRPAATTASDPALILVNLVGAGHEVARIVLRDVRWPEHILASWDRANSQATLQAIDREGRAKGPPLMAPWPLRPVGLQQLRLYHRAPLPSDRPELELLFLDNQGRPVFEACYDLKANVSLPPAGG